METMLEPMVVIPETNETHGTGWLIEPPDMRDYTDGHVEIDQILKAMDLPDNLGALPPMVDIRKYCSPIEDQGSLGSCTANAAVGIVEYFERRSFNKHIDGSRLFVYKTTRNLMGYTGDTGASIRHTMASLVLCGVPGEKFWPYTTLSQPGLEQSRTFDSEPSAFVYAVADNYEAARYFAHDPAGTNLATTAVLESVKKYLSLGIPSMFGFYGFDSFSKSNIPGGIPFPGNDERARWGHAIVAVGYDDNLKIKNTQYNTETTGALIIRNSWGTGWGDKGYGYLPYEYVLKKLAFDFWSLLSLKWIESGAFGIPGTVSAATLRAKGVPTGKPEMVIP